MTEYELSYKKEGERRLARVQLLGKKVKKSRIEDPQTGVILDELIRLLKELEA